MTTVYNFVNIDADNYVDIDADTAIHSTMKFNAACRAAAILTTNLQDAGNVLIKIVKDRSMASRLTTRHCANVGNMATFNGIGYFWDTFEEQYPDYTSIVINESDYDIAIIYGRQRDGDAWYIPFRPSSMYQIKRAMLTYAPHEAYKIEILEPQEIFTIQNR